MVRVAVVVSVVCLNLLLLLGWVGCWLVFQNLVPVLAKITEFPKMMLLMSVPPHPLLQSCTG